jgi:hypothetical protein
MESQTMATESSDQALMALLAPSAEDGAPAAATAAGAAPAVRLPPLEQRIDMFLHAIYGPDTTITSAMRSAARDHLITAMASDLADATNPAPLQLDPIVAAVQSTDAAINTSTSGGLTQLRSSLIGGLQQLLWPAAEAFSVRGLRLAAVPLLALIVVGSVWTGNWISDNGAKPALPGGNGATQNAPLTRSLAPPSHAVDSPTEQNLERAIAADEASLGPEHPGVARKLVDLARLYRLDGRYADAAALCTRALAIQQRALGPKDPDTIRTLNELATVYRAQGRNQEADDLLSRANVQ